MDEALVLAAQSSSASARRSLFPYVMIDRLTLWEAAAHPSRGKTTGRDSC